MGQIEPGLDIRRSVRTSRAFLEPLHPMMLSISQWPKINSYRNELIAQMEVVVRLPGKIPGYAIA